MAKVWLKCVAAPERYGEERLVTVTTASGTPTVFFAPARAVVEDAQGAHVLMTYCGRRAGCVLVAEHSPAEIEKTVFHLVAESDVVVLNDAHGAAAAALMPGRVTSPSRAEARANYSIARARYKKLREVLEDSDDNLALLDELWFALESAVDPFVRWEVIAGEEMGGEQSNGEDRRQ